VAKSSDVSPWETLSDLPYSAFWDCTGRYGMQRRGLHIQAREQIQVAELSGGHSSSTRSNRSGILGAGQRLIYSENIPCAAEYQRTSNNEASSTMAQITHRTARRFLCTERARLAPPCAEIPGADETLRLVGDACSQSGGSGTGSSDLSGRACTAFLGPKVGCSVATDRSDVCGGRRLAA
jgi:hypothetical protein